MDSTPVVPPQLFDAFPIGAAWMAPNDAVHLNAEAARIFGVGRRTLSLSEWEHGIILTEPTGRRLTRDEDPLISALAGGTLARTRLKVLREDGATLDVSVQAYPFRLDVDGHLCAAAVFEDLSWAQEEDRRFDEWLGALSHELSGALNSVSLGAELTRRLLADNPALARHHLDIVTRNARQLRRLVLDFVDSARLGIGAMECLQENVELSSYVGLAVENTEVDLSQHPLHLAIPPGLEVVADPGRLQQVFTNLLTNAAKYSAPGHLMLGATAQSERVVVWLKDQGPGIDEEKQKYLFHRYARLPSKQEGSGIGLWLSRELVRRMGGDIWLQSQTGGPTTFFISLPLARSVSEAAGAAR